MESSLLLTPFSGSSLKTHQLFILQDYYCLLINNMKSYAFIGGTVLGLLVGTALGFFVLPLLLAH